MITDQDVEKLKKTFVTKTEFDTKIDQIVAVMATKQELQEVRDDVKDIKGVVFKMFDILDGIAKRLDIHDMEYAALRISDDRQNKQIRQLARHTKYKFGTI